MAEIPVENWRLSGSAELTGNEFRFTGDGLAVCTCTLDQTSPMPVRISCESKGTDVDGNNAYEYSILAKITFQDGTTNRLSWAPFNDGTLFYTDYAPFPNRTHDWNERSFVLVYEKTIRTVELELIFRNHTGSASFRHVRVLDYECEDGVIFDTFPVAEPDRFPEPGIFLRDCSDSLFRPCAVPEHVELFSENVPDGDAVFHTVKLRSRDDADYALTVYYTAALPLTGGTVKYLPAMDQAVAADDHRDHFIVASWRAGANGLASRVPFAAVDTSCDGLALGFDPDYPAFGRVGYNAPFKRLYLAFDVALTKEHPEAVIRFVEYRFDRKDGFRAALKAYYDIFPSFFRARIKDQGNWMPFVPISSIPGWQDFGFKFMEAHYKPDDPEAAFDRANGIYSFRYTEPMTYWLRLPENEPRTRNGVRSWKHGVGAGTELVGNSVMEDENGDDVFIVLDKPWCHGAVWSINSMPDLPGNVTDSNTKWNERIEKTYHLPGSDFQLSGEYVDSAEGYVTADISHRRDHFAACRLPLTFSTDSLVPGIWKGTVAYEYIRHLRNRLLPRGEYVMANGTPGNMWFLPPLLDVSGTETDWNQNGEWTPFTVAEFRYCRAASADKPYCFLMNTDFTKFDAEKVVKYMKRSMVFGMFPGFFSANAATGHYFCNPSLFERDRAAFVKYLPLIKKLTSAGWRPVNGIKILCGGDVLAVERFGEQFVTVLNDSRTETMQGSLKIGGFENGTAVDLVSGKTFPVANGIVSFELASEDVLLLELKKNG